MKPELPKFKELVLRVVSKDQKIVTGLVLHNDIDAIVRAAPVLRYLIGWNRKVAKAHLLKHGWEIEVVFGEEPK